MTSSFVRVVVGKLGLPILIALVLTGFLAGCASVNPPSRRYPYLEPSDYERAPVSAAVMPTRDLTFYADGVVRLRDGFPSRERRFVPHGTATWIEFGSNHIRAVAAYLNGKLHGALFVYLSSGQTEMVAFYQDDRLDGTATVYYPSGQVKCMQSYVLGVAHGRYCYWYQNGVLFEEGEFVDGLKHGRWLGYWSNGVLASRKAYDQGEIVSQVSWNRNGVLSSD